MGVLEHAGRGQHDWSTPYSPMLVHKTHEIQILQKSLHFFPGGMLVWKPGLTREDLKPSPASLFGESASALSFFSGRQVLPALGKAAVQEWIAMIAVR